MVSFWEWAIGGVLVFIDAQARFNTPHTNRYTTTASGYYTAATLYLGLLGLGFILLGGGITVLPDFVSASPQVLAVLGDLPEKLPGPLLAALLLTTLLPNFPLLSRFDKWLRRTCYDIGNIPLAARRLSARMRSLKLTVPMEWRSAVETKLTGFAPEDLRWEPDGSLQHRWTAVAALYLQLTRWSERRRYDVFLERFHDEVATLESEIDVMVARAVVCLPILKSTNASTDEGLLRAVAECEKHHIEQADRLYKKLCDLAARGVLRCELLKKERTSMLQRIGFTEFQEESEILRPDQVLGLGVAVFLVLVTSLLMFGGDQGVGRKLQTAAMVATIYCFAVVAAIFPKERYEAADRRRTGYRPVAAYLLSGVAGACLAFNVSLLIKFLSLRDFLHALGEFGWSYPWFVMSFVVAASLAFLADDYVTATNRPRWARWIEGAAEAGLVGAAAWVTYLWLASIPEVPTGRVPDPASLVPTCAAIGFVLGCCVPHWYRSVDRQSPGRESALESSRGRAGDLSRGPELKGSI